MCSPAIAIQVSHCIHDVNLQQDTVLAIRPLCPARTQTQGALCACVTVYAGLSSDNSYSYAGFSCGSRLLPPLVARLPMIPLTASARSRAHANTISSAYSSPLPRTSTSISCHSSFHPFHDADESRECPEVCPRGVGFAWDER